MPNKKKLYEALKAEGYDNFADEYAFNSYVDNPDNRKKLFDALKSEGYDNFADEKSFDAYLGYSVPQSNNSGEQESVIDVPSDEMTDDDTQGSYQYDPKVQKHILENKPDMFKPKTVDMYGAHEKDKSEFDLMNEGKLYQMKAMRAASTIGEQLNERIKANEEALNEARKKQAEGNLQPSSNNRGRYSSVGLGGTIKERQEAYEKSYGKSPSRVEQTNMDDDVANLLAEQEYLKESKKVLDAAKNDAGFFQGMKDAIDASYLSFGLTDKLSAERIDTVQKKLSSGEALSDSEQSLLTSLGLQQMVNEQYNDLLGRWYKAGMVTAEMAPFMAEMAVNPLSGLGKSAMNMAVRKFGEKGAKAIAAKVLSRTIGDVAGAAGMAATTSMAGVTADAMARQRGYVKTDLDEKQGTIKGVGFEGGEDASDAWRKAFTSRTIENWSEMVGEYFSPIGKAVGKGFTKAFNKMGLSKVNDFIDNINSSEWVKLLDDFSERTQWNGPLGEFAEEQVGMVANAALVGDTKWSDITDLDQQLDVALGVGVFGTVMSLLRIGGYRTPKYRARKAVEGADKEGAKLYGEELWANVKETIGLSSDEELGKNLAELIAATGSNQEQAEAAFKYANALKAQQAVNTVKEKAKIDMPGDMAVEAEAAYDEGSELETPLEKHEAKRAVDRAEAALGVGSENSDEQLFAQMVMNGADSPVETVNAMAERGYTEEQIQKAKDYYTAVHRMNGLTDALLDSVNSQIESANAEVDANTNKDNGSVTKVILRDGREGYVVEGSVVRGENGIVDVNNSDDTVMVRLQNGEVQMMNPNKDIYGVAWIDSPEQVKEEINVVLREKLIDQAIGEIDWNPATPNPKVGDSFEMDGIAVTIVGHDGHGGMFVLPSEEWQAAQGSEQKQQAAIAKAQQMGVVHAGIFKQWASDQLDAQEEAQAMAQQEAETVTNSKGLQPVAEGVASGEELSPVEEKRPMTEDEAASFIFQMERNAVEAPEIELTPENWIAEFGEDGLVETPIGQVKFGQNQYVKLQQMGRRGKLGMIKPTLTEPDVIVEDKRPSKDGTEERDFSYVFVKAFTGKDGKRMYYFTSVTIRKDGSEVVISNQEKSLNKISRLLQGGNVVWTNSLFSSHPTTRIEESVPLNDSNKPTSTDNQSAWLGINSSELSTNKDSDKNVQSQENKDKPLHEREKEDVFRELGEKYGEKMPRKVEVTAKALADDLAKAQKKLDKAIEEYDNAPIGREEKAEKARDKAQEEFDAIQREADFWAALDKEIKDAQTIPGDEVAEEILSMEEPLNGEEFAAQMLANGNIKLLQDSFASETGFGKEEAKKYFGLFASSDKGGMTIQQAGERLMEADRENGTNFFDQNDPNAGRNAIIQVLGMAKTKKDLANILPNNRAEQARKEQEAEFRAYESWVEENFHMSVADFEAYEEMIARDLSERGLSETEYQEFISTFVDETFNKVEDEQQGIIAESEGSSEVLPGTQPLQAEGAGRVEERPEKTDGGIVGENGAVPEGASGSEVEGSGAVEEAQEVLDNIKKARKEVDTNPTEAQKEAGNYKKGHIKIDGFDITIENPKGGVRSGTDKNGKKWSITMNNDYGYIRGTEAVDGDHIDVFLSPFPTQGSVFVVDQSNEDGSFDESKVMYGFSSLEEARAAYLSNYEKGWENRIMAITEVSKEEFKKWIDSSHRKTKAFSEYKSVKAEEQAGEPSGNNPSPTDEQSEGIGSGTPAESETSQASQPSEVRKPQIADVYAAAEKIDAEEKRRRPLRNRANEWAKALGVKVHFIERVEDVKSANVRKALKNGNKVAGWYSQVTGEVFFLMPNLDNVDEIDNTYVHEVVAHKGMFDMLGKERYDALCDKVWEMMPKSEQKRFINYPGVNGNTRIAADEYIAHLSESLNLSPEQQGIWDKIVQFFRELFDQKLNGILSKSNITKEDISNLIKASYANLKSGANENVVGEGERFRFSKTPEEFDAIQKEAVEKKGIVMPGLNEAVVDVLSIEKHDFNGNLKQARKEAKQWAIENYQGKEFSLPDEGGLYTIGKKAINKYVDKTSVDKSDDAMIHLSALKELPNIISSSVTGEIHADYKKDENEKRNTENGIKDKGLLVHRMYGAIKLDDKMYRVKTTMNEYRDPLAANNPHSYEVTEIELIESSSTPSSKDDSKLVNVSNNSITGAKLLNGVEKSYDKGKKLLDESEKTRFRVVYHGSGAEFDKFDHSFMGTGEGNQSFGWGTYVTDVKGIGENYGTIALRGKDMFEYIGDQSVNRWVLADAKQMMDRAGGYDEMIKLYGNATLAPGTAAEQAVNFLKSTKKEDWEGQRHLYEVEIPDDNGSNYIAWDKMLPKEQAERIKEAIRNSSFFKDYEKEYKRLAEERLDAWTKTNGGRAYKLLGNIVWNEKDLSQILSEAGFVGFKYPTNYMSGGNKEGTNNYVIFNEDDLKIVEHTRFRLTNAEKEALRDSEETKALFDYAKKRFGRTFDLREAGYVLPDGSMLDFSGRHEMSPGSDTSFLRGDRTVDHRYVQDLNYDPEDDGGEKTGFKTDMADFINRGAIRIDNKFGLINLSMKPTKDQKVILQRLIQKNDGDVYLDFADGWDAEHHAEYEGVRPMRVFSDIDKYYDEGIKPEGNTRFRVTPEHKQHQMDIINETNPSQDDVHTWIRSVEDIKSFEEALDDSDYADYKGEDFDPSYTWNMVEDALETGKVTVYSSYPIKNGVFVTPSYMEAQSYGGTTPYMAKVNLEDVAWIDPTQGQLATDNKVTSKKAPSGVRFRVSNRNQEIFVSNAQKAVEGIKQEKGTPQQWLAMIEKNGGLKAGEDKWLGLSDWLKGLDKKSVTKAEILDFIDENKIVIEEVKYAAGGGIEALRDKYPTFDDAFYVHESPFGVSVDIKDNKKAAEIVFDIQSKENPYAAKYEVDEYEDFVDNDAEFEIRERIEYAIKYEGATPINSTRLEYTTEGLDNKQEIALTVPTIEPWNKNDDIHFGDAGEGRAIAWIRFGETTATQADFEKAAREADEALTAYQNELADKYIEDGGSGDPTEYLDMMNEEEIKKMRELSGKMIETRDEANANQVRVLVIDEIQSKRHQEGREKGYRNIDAEKELEVFKGKLKEKYPEGYSAPSMTLEQHQQIQRIYPNTAWLTDEERGEYEELQKKAGVKEGVPEAPFEKNWSELAFKRMLRYAAENGFDKVAWTKGEQQADRYNLSKVVDNVRCNRVGKNGNKSFVLEGIDYNVVTNNEGLIIAGVNEFKGKYLSEIVGSSLADKMLGMEEGDVLNNTDLRIGGEGMKGFYDKMLPSFVNKYVKKWGTKVQDIELPNVEEAGRIMHSVDVTDVMKESVMEGQIMFRIVDNEKQKHIDKEYVDAVHEGDFGKAVGLFREYVLSKAEEYGVVPIDYAVGYRGHSHSSIAKKVKEENPDAISEAAYQMSKRVPKCSILVPMPSRSGKATYTIKLAEAIAKATDSEVKDVLKGEERMSVYEAKKKGLKIESRDLGLYVTEKLPKDKNVIIIDNVIDRGITALAAVEAVDGGSVLAYAFTKGSKDRVVPLKLSDPITYDDNLRIIPLSERFNANTDDLRFRVLRDPAVDYISQAEDVVEVPRGEVMYTMNNIAPQLYKTSGRFMRQLYKYGTLGRVLKGEYAEIDQIKAKQEYDHAKPILEEYLNELVWMKYQATEAAQEVINDVISDVEYAMQYYKDLSLGKDVWRTHVSPRFRISDYGKQVKAEVDKVTSKYNSKDVMFFDSEMTDEEISSIHPDLTREDVMPLFENNVLGGYSSRMDNISIFANNVPIDNVEDTIFHENVHALLQNGQSIIDAFAENALERFPKNVKRIQERGYDEEEVAEELLVRLVAKAMVYGIFDDVAYNLPESEFENLKVLLKDFGYEYEQEVKSRSLEEGRRGTPTLLGGEEVFEARRVRQDSGRQKEERRARKEELGKLFDQVADMGLDGVLENRYYGKLLMDIYQEMPLDVRRYVSASAINQYGGNFVPAMSDYLNVKATAEIWGKVVGFIRDALRKVGFDLELNQADVKYMLWRSQKPMKKYSALDVAEDIDARRKFGVDGDSGVRFSVKNASPFDPSDKRNEIVKEYDAFLKKGKFNFIEAFQDRMYSVKVFMDMIVGATGKKVRDYEDAYTAENQLGSVNKPMQEKYLDKFYKPLLEEIKKLSDKYGREVVERYIYCKSGLERNEVLRQRDADEAYNSSKAELDEKLAKNEINQAQYNALLAQIDAQKQKTLSEDVDYSGIRGMLYNVKAQQINDDYESGKIDKVTRDQQLAKLEANRKDEVKDWKGFAEKQVAALEGKASTKELDALWNKINAATNETLRMDYESGMIDKETYDAEKNMMKYYVPLRNWDDTTAEEMYEYRSELVRPVSSNQKRAKGRESQADNPIATIGLMSQNAIVRGNRNKVKQKFYAFVANRETSLATVRDVWYVKDAQGNWVAEYADTSSAKNSAEFEAIIDQFEEDMKLREEQGMAFRGKLPMGMKFKASGRQKQAHVVPVMINGKEYAVYVNGNPRPAQAMNGETNSEAANAKWEWYDKIKRMYSAGLTSWNPDFIIPNMIRDGIHASTMTLLDAGPIAAAKFALNGPRAFAQVFTMISGKGKSLVNPKYQAYFEEFIANGGETGYTAINTLEDYKKEYDKLINKAKGANASNWVKDGFSAIGGLIETANRIFEDVNRFNAYVSARESGESIMRSVNAAKNITVNFNRKGAGFANNSVWGTVAGWMSKWILFFNPAVQGIEQLITKSKANPKRATAMGATILSSGFMIPMINELLVAALGGDDEDDYWNQSDYKRRNNWMLYTGDGYVTIPLPPVLRELYGIGDVIYGSITGHIAPERAVMDVARQAQSAVGFFNLIPEASQEPDMITYAKGFAPDLAAPFLDVLTNTNFMGRPIAKWTDYNEYNPEYERVYKGTSKQWVEVSKFLNELGGNEGRRSDVWGNFINPAMMEHLITSYGGGIGKTINNLAGMAIDIAEGDTENLDPFRKSPIVPRFYTPVDEKSAVPGINRKYYDYDYRYNVAKKALKNYQECVASKEHPEYQKYIDEMKENGEIRFMNYFKSMSKQIKDIQNRIKENPRNKKELEEKLIEMKAQVSVKCTEILK